MGSIMEKGIMVLNGMIQKIAHYMDLVSKQAVLATLLIHANISRKHGFLHLLHYHTF
jgi:hypothetical protein